MIGPESDKNQLTCQTGNQRSRKNSLKFNLCDGELWKWNCIVKEKLQKRDQIWKSRGGHRRCWRAPSRRIQGAQRWRRPAFVWKSKQIDTGWRLLFFFSDWDAIGINFAETSLRWQVTNLIQFSICLSVLRFVTTSRVNFCNLYKFFKKTMIFFLQNCTIFTLNKCGFTLNC